MSSYVVYEKDSTIILKNASGSNNFRSASIARAHITRLVKSGKYTRDQLEVEDYMIFVTTIEKKHMVKNLITGKMVEESVNTPYCCSVASATYWAS